MGAASGEGEEGRVQVLATVSSSSSLVAEVRRAESTCLPPSAPAELHSSPPPPPRADSIGPMKPRALLDIARTRHARLPGIRRIPFPALGIIAAIALVNAVAWIVVGIILQFHRALISTALISYTLGLRHALDADHISAIDLVTRRLIASGQRPVSVGTFFSLGHSTIVIVTAVAVAATAATVENRFDGFGTVGGIIGTAVSASFLILLGVMNAYILYRLVKQMKKVLNLKEGEEDQAWKVENGGCLFTVLKAMFKIIDRPWKMYPLGVLFGLGFDTSSEIALLGISSIQAAHGTSIWLILIFPLLFTVGMCLVDTMDGALMLTVYILPKAMTSDGIDGAPLIAPSSSTEGPEEESSAAATRDPVAFLYYSIVLTSLTVLVALVIGTLQLLSLVLNVAHPTGSFWDGVGVAGDHYDVIGGSICGSFLVFGGLSVLCYKPWRRRVGRAKLAKAPDLEDAKGHASGDELSGAVLISPA